MIKNPILRLLFTSLFILFTLFTLSTQLLYSMGEPKNESQKEETYKALHKFAYAFEFIEKMYIDPKKASAQNLIDEALIGMTSHLDPHTVIMPKKSFEQLTTDTKGKFGGIGIILSQEKNRLIIIAPIEGSPAYREGIKSGDEIIAIDDIPISSLKEEDPTERMKGPVGKSLKLLIKRKDIETELTFEMNREIIKIPSVRKEILAEDILYVRIASFQENTTQELDKILKQTPKLKGLVIDLRDNPGGLLDQAIKTADLFIESGLIVSTIGRDPTRIEREFAHMSETYKGFPIIILVNGGSASAAEILTGALQDYELALVLGTQTFGKGSVQTLLSLPDGSGLKLTIARYYTPKGRSIQAKGIEPDITINPNPTQNLKEKKESDLERHLDSTDLYPAIENSTILKEIEHWPKNLKEDKLLGIGFSYLKGWSVFQKTKKRL